MLRKIIVPFGKRHAVFDPEIGYEFESKRSYTPKIIGD